MIDYYLAIDIGASGGRHILGHMEGDRLILEEVYRFENHMDEKDGSLTWDTERLFKEILEGMKVCKRIGKTPHSLGIDTWGVDYALLDGEGKLLDRVYAYRDHRTDLTDKELENIISADTLYEHTGIQKQKFNTVYQLFNDKKIRPKVYESAKHMLLLPDYFVFMLTGNISSEYTNATTTGLVNANGCDWDNEIIDALGIRKELLSKIVRPGTLAGGLKKDIAQIVGYDTRVIKIASHDTASAVAAVPAQSETVFISSGTWSLLGTERKKCDCSKEAQNENFTNEGGVEQRYRFLKNIMGMWMIQSLRHEFDDRYGYEEIAKLAEERFRSCSDDAFDKVIDVNDSRFLSPISMREAIDEVCLESGIEPPLDIAGYALLIYRSLAACYKKTIDKLEEITKTRYETIHIVGGGSKATFLNGLLQKATNKRVCVGPAEATAVGNLFVQIVADGVCENITQARKNIKIEES
ncbi:MAG: rhamnulokinase [Lachnospiraceae bacterium]|nr:rhamnulokinase [Lachnospiraceae bacterium]